MKKLGKFPTVILGLAVMGSVLTISSASSSALIPPPGPKSGSVGVEGTIPSPPPSQGATIIAPANGQVFSTTPITVSGFCPKGVLVKIFSNNIFIGSAICTSGSYTIQVTLFSGRNDLVARVFDALDQEGPLSNTVSVTFNDAQYAAFGSHVLITSQYARRGADPGKELSWPVILSGGIGPYALTVDWGDGTPTELRSEPFAGVIIFTHTYKGAGTYNIIFRAADHNGTAAYLQVVGVISGQASSKINTGGATTTPSTAPPQVKVLWQPAAILLLLAIITFWLGRRYELAALRKRIEREYQA